jgi:hypothetical protein
MVKWWRRKCGKMIRRRRGASPQGPHVAHVRASLGECERGVDPIQPLSLRTRPLHTPVICIPRSAQSHSACLLPQFYSVLSLRFVMCKQSCQSPFCPYENDAPPFLDQCPLCNGPLDTDFECPEVSAAAELPQEERERIERRRSCCCTRRSLPLQQRTFIPPLDLNQREWISHVLRTLREGCKNLALKV